MRAVRSQRTRSSTPVLWTLFFAICTQVFAYEAQSDTAGVAVGGRALLATGATQTLCWVLAGLCAVVTLAGVLRIVLARRAGRRV